MDATSKVVLGDNCNRCVKSALDFSDNEDYKHFFIRNLCFNMAEDYHFKNTKLISFKTAYIINVYRYLSYFMFIFNWLFTIAVSFLYHPGWGMIYWLVSWLILRPLVLNGFSHRKVLGRVLFIVNFHGLGLVVTVLFFLKEKGLL